MNALDQYVTSAPLLDASFTRPPLRSELVSLRERANALAATVEQHGRYIERLETEIQRKNEHIARLETLIERIEAGRLMRLLRVLKH